MKNKRAEEMRSHYEKWRQSGKSKPYFCKAENLVKSTFYYWVKKFEQSQPSSTSPEGFTPLPSPIVFENNTALCRIHYPSGISVDVFDARIVSFLKKLC